MQRDLLTVPAVSHPPRAIAFLLQGLVVAIKQIHKNRVGESSNRKLLESEIRIMTVCDDASFFSRSLPEVCASLSHSLTRSPTLANA